jgi:hypothetical protein
VVSTVTVTTAQGSVYFNAFAAVLLGFAVALRITRTSIDIRVGRAARKPEWGYSLTPAFPSRLGINQDFYKFALTQCLQVVTGCKRYDRNRPAKPPPNQLQSQTLRLDR